MIKIYWMRFLLPKLGLLCHIGLPLSLLHTCHSPLQMLQGQGSDAERPSWKPSFPSSLESQREVDTVTAHFSGCVSRSLLPLIFPDWLEAVNGNFFSLSWWHGACMHVQMLLWLQVIDPPVHFPCHCKVLIALSNTKLYRFWAKAVPKQRPLWWEENCYLLHGGFAACQILHVWSVQGVLTPTHCFVWW